MVTYVLKCIDLFDVTPNNVFSPQKLGVVVDRAWRSSLEYCDVILRLSADESSPEPASLLSTCAPQKAVSQEFSYSR
jgi:hypothetical protein